MARIFSAADFAEETSAPAPQAGGKPVLTDADFAPDEPQGPQGASPEDALPESPLNVLQRGALGFAGKPEEQQKLLQSTFGNKNVSLVPGDDGMAKFVVKSEDGKWRQVDPSGWSDLPGDVADFLGKKGPQAIGATIGGAKGAAMGGAVGGPIGAGIGLLAGGALGAAGAEVATQGGKALASAAGVSGAPKPVQNYEEAKQEMGAALLFGAEQELGGALFRGGAKAVKNAFGYALKRIGATPEGKAAATSIVQTMTGQPQAVVRARIENPLETARFDKVASRDLTRNTDTLLKMQKRSVEDFFEGANKARQTIGTKYTEIQKKAQGAIFDIPEEAIPGGGTKRPLMDAFDALQERGYVDQAGKVVGKGTGGITKTVEGTNRRAVMEMLQQKAVLDRAVKTGRKLTYKELDNAINNLDNYLYGGEISDKSLQGVMTQVRAQLKNAQNAGLAKVDPKLALDKRALDQQYGPVKELLGELSDKVAPDRLDAFLKKVVRQDGSFNAELMQSISTLVGKNNPTERILRMESARRSTALFKEGAGKVLGTSIPVSPKFGAAVVSAGAQAKGAVDQAAAAIPYMKQAAQVYKGLSKEARKAAVRNPEAIKALSDVVVGGVQSEQQQSQELIDYADKATR